MYTANDANNDYESDLDDRIKDAVKDCAGGYKAAYLRIYCEDPWFRNIEYELERRGFHSIRVPDVILKGDVYFSWAERDEEK